MFISNLAINRGKNNRLFTGLIGLNVDYLGLTSIPLDLPFVYLLTLCRRALT